MILGFSIVRGEFVGGTDLHQSSDNGLIPKNCLSSDWGLQLDPMKSESLVIA